MKFASADNEERMGFVQKVYGIVALQVGVTALMCLLSMVNLTILQFMLDPGIIALSTICLIVITLMLCCSKDMRSAVPRNYCLLLIFTLCEGHLVSIVCNSYSPETVALALVLTAGIFFVMTGYAMTAKKDYTISWKLMLALICASLLIGVLKFFFNSSALEILTCFLGIVIACFYILYDTQRLIGNHNCKFDLDDYILAALDIYLNIIKLFLELLKLLDKLSDKKKDDK